MIKLLRLPVNNKVHSGSILQRYFTSITLPRIQKYDDLTYQMLAINILLNEQLRDQRHMLAMKSFLEAFYTEIVLQ